MAIYSCNISNVSRGGGSNSCATLSYIAGSKIEGSKVYCERTNQTFSYGRSERVVALETCLPAHAPAEFKDPAVLFNAIENFEKAENARTAKKIMVALPREINSLENQQELMREFCSQITKMGYACTFAIHCDKDDNNPHAHVLVANRPINNKGEFLECKQKMAYVLDDKGERVPLIDKETGLQKLGRRNEKLWKRTCVKSNPLDEKTTLQAIRENWENVCNKRLEPAQHITAKSHETRGLKTEPTIHEGYAAREIERRGGKSELCEINRQIIQYNRIINAIKVFEKQLAQLLMPKKKQVHHAPASAERKAFLDQQRKRATTERRVIKQQRAKKEAEERAKQEKARELARQAELARQQQQQQQRQPVYSPPPPPRKRSRGMSR